MSAVNENTDLQCSICDHRLTEPKTLICTHTFCLQCLQSLMQLHGNIKCPECSQTCDLKMKDLNKLGTNEKVCNLLDYVKKVESETPDHCSKCTNEPSYHCGDCKLYLCGECLECHRMFPTLNDHSLYRIDKNKENRGKDEQYCQTHRNKQIDFYCKTCKEFLCTECRHFVEYSQNKHHIIPMRIAADEFNQNATEIINIAEKIKCKLHETLETIIKDRSDFDAYVKLCTAEIQSHEKEIIKKVKKISMNIIEDLENIYKEKKKTLDSQAKTIDCFFTQVNELLSINTMANTPEEIKSLESHKTTINILKEKVLRDNIDKSFQRRKITPAFIPSAQLDIVLNKEGIGKITTIDGTYKVAKEDESITVTNGQQFEVKVSRIAKSEQDKLSATLVHSSAKVSATTIEDQGNGKYRIRGRCDMDGNWLMEITVGHAHIEGSPLNVKVEKLGLVQTIGNITIYKKHDRQNNVTDAMLDADGYILVSSFSKDLLRFSQSGSLAFRIEVPHEVQVNSMHKMTNGHIVFSDVSNNSVVICDDKFIKMCLFGKGILKYPRGLTVNETTRIMYVADCGTHCVFKFNVDNGALLGKIGSEGSKFGQMKHPADVTLTNDGHVLVTDFGNNRVQLFDGNDKFIRIMLGCGKEDGKLWGPHGLIIDMDENLLISSCHKLQLFDKNGVFIKRIDDKDDGLDVPAGNCVISNRPRRVAVANYRANNVKIFNY